MHELETRTVAHQNDFRTSYRCPFCRFGIDDIGELL